MTLDELAFLLSPEGQKWLAAAAVIPITPQNHLQIASQLRQNLLPQQAQAVLETVLLRQLGTVKFSRAAEMYFVREALEQASSESVAAHRAQRFFAAGFEHIADLGCGIGGDALALAAQAHVIGVELDSVRLAMAQENVRVYGRAAHFRPLQSDLLELSPLPVQACFFDPARRDEYGRRLFSVHDYQPPLSLIDRWRGKMMGTAVKVSPGVNYAELPEDAEIELISLNGDVKGAVLWFGDLHSGVNRRATLLPDGSTLTNADLPSAPIPTSEPLKYLYEPDKAIIRAHLVEALAYQLDACKLSDDIAYLTSATAQATPFARCFAIEDSFPFQLKRLRHYLRQHDIGQVTVKKRGSPLEPDALRHQLRLKGSQHRIIFLTQVKGETAVLIGHEINHEQ
ncbi:MAG: SAM-dependent methyltransferase [Ardenticatenaceae bacterium]|nr:SAM-dependent methyltransferase [Ardenticatenaceae bacterium]MCB9445244.1 SAM-dependent methyltransferase [Ardenticatenaceae bacterium]